MKKLTLLIAILILLNSNTNATTPNNHMPNEENNGYTPPTIESNEHADELEELNNNLSLEEINYILNLLNLKNIYLTLY